MDTQDAGAKANTEEQSSHGRVGGTDPAAVGTLHSSAAEQVSNRSRPAMTILLIFVNTSRLLRRFW
jgi:hypothetical protein